MELIDTHTHIDREIFDPTREELLTQARGAGIRTQIIAGFVASGWKRLLKLCDREVGLHPALGLHPLYTSEHTPEDLSRLRSFIKAGNDRSTSPPLIVAIGEIGLDYFTPDHEKERQQFFFEEQLNLAKEFHLPVLLHVRKAHDQVLATLRRKHFTNGGIVHAFNGSMQQASHYQDLGFVFGFGGTLTYPRATRIHTLAQNLPLSAIVLETDAPDLPPYSHQGSTNLPHYLLETAQTLANLRRCPLAEIAATTTETAKRVLSLN